MKLKTISLDIIDAFSPMTSYSAAMDRLAHAQGTSRAYPCSMWSIHAEMYTVTAFSAPAWVMNVGVVARCSLRLRYAFWISLTNLYASMMASVFCGWPIANLLLY